MTTTAFYVPAKFKTMLDNMNLLDRFLFNETVEDPEVYRIIVEIILGENISTFTQTETEKELGISPQLKQIRLDVFGTNEEGDIFQMEMQKRNTYNLPKRSRIYQAQIDVTLLEPGCKDYNKLNDLTTILIAPFDIFGYGLYRYTFEEHCLEIPELKLGDGSRRIFINTKGNNPEKFSQEFLDLMEYINHSTDVIAHKSNSNKIQQIHQRVCTVRALEKTGVKFMQWWEEKAYAREEGWSEGHEEGLTKGIAEGELALLVRMVCRKFSKGLSPEQIADHLETDIEQIVKICNVASSYAPDYDTERIVNELMNKTE